MAMNSFYERLQLRKEGMASLVQLQPSVIAAEFGWLWQCWVTGNRGRPARLGYCFNKGLGTGDPSMPGAIGKTWECQPEVPRVGRMSGRGGARAWGVG